MASVLVSVNSEDTDSVLYCGSAGFAMMIRVVIFAWILAFS
jgi:hypothetical protein